MDQKLSCSDTHTTAGKPQPPSPRTSPLLRRARQPNVKSLILSPVHVRRSTSSRREESCTQTSKTIIELARLEKRSMTPDSLNSSPDSGRAMEYELHRSTPMVFGGVNGRRRSKSDISLSNNMDSGFSLPYSYELLENRKKLIRQGKQRLHLSEIEAQMCFSDEARSGRQNSHYVQGDYERYLQNNLRNHQKFDHVPREYQVNQNSALFSPQQYLPPQRNYNYKATPPLAYNRDNYEIVRAKIYNERNANISLSTPVVVNVKDNNCNPKPNLLQQFLTSKSSASNKLRSHSFIDPPVMNRSLSPIPQNRNTLRFYKTKDSCIAETKQDRSVRYLIDVRDSGKGEGKKPQISRRNQSVPKATKSEEIAKVDKAPSCSDSYCSTMSVSLVSESGLISILNHVKSPDWCLSLKGFAEIVELGQHGEPEVLLPHMPIVHQKLLELLRSPRSHVCRTACQMSGQLFEIVKDTRRPEFDDIVDVLLQKTADSNKFIRHDANLALDSMVTHVHPFHSIRTICSKGPVHRNPLVRCATIRLIICAVVMAGADAILLSQSHEHTRKRVMSNMVVFLNDRNLETRKYAERLYRIMTHAAGGDLDSHIRKYLDSAKYDTYLRFLKTQKKK